MERSGARVLVDCLIEQGVTTAFGVPGESYLAVLDALHDTPGIRMVPNRQEGGAAFMAAAWGKLTGRPGICLVTRGPGATNAAIGIHTARQDSAPMIVFVGQVATGMIGREAFQEVDYRAAFGPLAKWATEIDDPGRIPEIVARAFAVAATGRPGPVVVALPEDVLAASTAARPGPRVRIPQAAAAPEDVAEIARRLDAARAPLVLVAGGGWGAPGRAGLRAFAEANRLPVLAGFRCQDLLDNASPSYAGDAGLGKSPAVRALIGEADLILAIGVRFGEILTDGYTLFDVPKMAATLIHAHASGAELNRIQTADLPVVAHRDRLMPALAGLRLDGAGRWVADRGRPCRLARRPRDAAAAGRTRHGRSRGVQVSAVQHSVRVGSTRADLADQLGIAGIACVGVTAVIRNHGTRDRHGKPSPGWPRREAD